MTARPPRKPLARSPFSGTRGLAAAIRIVAPLLLIIPTVSPAHAHTSPDAAKILAELKSMPEGFGSGRPESIPPAVLNEVHNKIEVPANAPKSWTFILGGDNPRIVTGKRRPDGILDVTVDDGYRPDSYVLDPLGLLPNHLVIYLEKVAALSISNRISVSAAISGTFNIHYLSIWDVYEKEAVGTVDNLDCSLSGIPESSADEDCVLDEHSWYWRGNAPDYSDERPHPERVKFHYTWNSRLGLFVRDNILDLNHPMDWRIGGGPWHSQEASAALSPAQREQARGLFARGFDLYKAGDLDGAKPLIQAGLQIDPGNHLGWFTLGEIDRSEAAQKGKNAFNAHVYYQHAIDLAPDSVEAIQAKGYLHALR